MNHTVGRHKQIQSFDLRTRQQTYNPSRVRSIAVSDILEVSIIDVIIISIGILLSGIISELLLA